MEFRYKAKKSLNDIIEGKLEAETVEQVIEKLERQGMIAVSVEQEKSGQTQGQKAAHIKLGKWGAKQLVLFTQKLYNLIKSRVELLSALNLLKQASNDKTEIALLEDIIKNIKEGMMFSQCLSRYPQYFSLLYINIIRTGESSGQLKEALGQILARLQHHEELRGKIRQALAYPIFMIIVGIGTIFVMLTFILPRLAGMFEDFQAALPLPTVILLTVAGFLKKYWITIIIFLCVLITLLQRKRKDGSTFFSQLKYRLPLIKRLIYKQSVANFSTSTALLLKSGVTLLSALAITAPIIQNPKYIKQLGQVSGDIKEGSSFSQALSKFKIFPDFFVQMIRVGEEGGRLDSVLDDIADSYEQEIEGDLKIISSLLEPAIILILGLVIGGIVMAVLLPIFNINTLVGS
jgi:type II secretory pathway component PulF